MGGAVGSAEVVAAAKVNFGTDLYAWCDIPVHVECAKQAVFVFIGGGTVGGQIAVLACCGAYKQVGAEIVLHSQTPAYRRWRI